MKACDLAWFLIWVNNNNNTGVRITEVNYNTSLQLAKQYKKAVSGKHKYCKCKNKGEAVTEYWKIWHCTYCFKLKKSEKF